MKNKILAPQSFSEAGWNVVNWKKVEEIYLKLKYLAVFYVYVLQSLKDKGFYIGFTIDLAKRVKRHNLGGSTATKFRRPLKLIYYEAGLNKTDALHREIYLKTAWGRRYVNNRIKNYEATVP